MEATLSNKWQESSPALDDLKADSWRFGSFPSPPPPIIYLVCTGTAVLNHLLEYSREPPLSTTRNAPECRFLRALILCGRQAGSAAAHEIHGQTHTKESMQHIHCENDYLETAQTQNTNNSKYN